MEKPASMSLKEWLIKKLTLKIMQPEKIIGVVIEEQFNKANDALNLHDTIELSGFGKFTFNRKRAEKRMGMYLNKKGGLLERLESETITETTRKNLESKLEILELNIKILKSKLK